MTLNLWRRREPLDPAELARLLPAPGAPALAPDRHLLLEEHVMHQIKQHDTAAAPAAATPSRSRRRLAVRLAGSVAVAAATAGAFLALNPSTTAVAGHTPAATGTTASSPDLQISTVAYTLKKEAGGDVQVTVHRNAAVDPAQLQKDLARVGITSTVTKSQKLDPDLQAVNVPPRRKNGDYVVTIVPNKHEEIIFRLGNNNVEMNITPK
jgi:hypothetical protein